MTAGKQRICVCVGILMASLVTGTRAVFGAGEIVMPANGTFQIRNKKQGDLLRPKDANNGDGTPIVLYPAQNWKCMAWKMEAAGKDEFTLQNVFTGKTLTATGKQDDGTTAVVQVPIGNKGSSRPIWQFQKLPDGAYAICDKSGARLTVKSSNSDSAVVVLSPAKEQAEQEWELLAAPEHFDM